MLGVVVLNYNTKKMTTLALKNLLKMSAVYKIILVDNNSEDNSLEYLKKLFKDEKRISYIKSDKNLGYAKGNNLGILELERDERINYIGVMNPDVQILSNNSLNNCLEILKSFEDISAVNPTMLLNNKINQELLAWKVPKGFDDIFLSFSFLKKIYNPLKYQEYFVKKYKNIYFSEVEILPGSFFIMKKEFFKKINYFDQNTFLYCEERIIGVKLKQLGMKQAVLMNEFYEHNHFHKEKTLKAEIYHLKELFKSRIYYNKKYNERVGKFVGNFLILFLYVAILERIIIKFIKSFKK